MPKISPMERAKRSSRVMWLNDRASPWLGISLDDIGPGTATTSMTIEDHHLNSHDICHGGLIFALADSAFAFACNSYNQVAVAQHNSISFINPAEPGERLVAHAVEISRSGRSGIYDVSVAGNHGRIIAEFRGGSRTVRGSHFNEDEG